MTGAIESEAGPARAPIDVLALIDARGLGARQLGVVVLCGLVALLDGLDLQSIGLVAPAMMAALKIAPGIFSFVFSAALAGLAIGAFTLGPIADRVGRKRVLVGATLCFGAFTLATAFAGGVAELLTYRFLAGLGLGGAMPSFISLTCEYVPRRMRAAVVSLLYAGFPLGGVVGGLLGSWIIPRYGWPSVFLVGGTVPIVLGVVLVVLLPESIGFLLATGAPAERIAGALAYVVKREAIPPGAAYRKLESQAEGVPVVQLFTEGRGSTTILLWLGFFSAFMVLVINSSWSPSLLRGAGLSIPRSALAMAAFNFGSVFGTGAAGLLVARLGALVVLPAAFVGSGVAIALVGYAAPDMTGVTVAETCVGIFLGCASSGLIALAATSYPTAIRSTGVGWSMGMGRIGSFTGPLAVGVLVAVSWSITSTFTAIALSLLIGAVAVVVLGARERRYPDMP